jgi:hypothetical protein
LLTNIKLYQIDDVRNADDGDDDDDGTEMMTQRQCALRSLSKRYFGDNVAFV